MRQKSRAFRGGLAVTGALALALPLPALAQLPADYDWGSSAARILVDIPLWLAVVFAVMFVVGVAFILNGLARAKTVGDVRGANQIGGHQTSWFGPMNTVIMGVFLAGAPIVMLATKTQFFGEDSNYEASINTMTSLPQAE
jgi:hypothetical protein